MMAEKVQQLSDSQDYGETDFHDEWKSLEPAIDKKCKDHTGSAFQNSLLTDVNLGLLASCEKAEESCFGVLNEASFDRKGSQATPLTNKTTDSEKEPLFLQNASEGALGHIGKDTLEEELNDSDELNFSCGDELLNLSLTSVHCNGEAEISGSTTPLQISDNTGRARKQKDSSAGHQPSVTVNDTTTQNVISQGSTTCTEGKAESSDPGKGTNGMKVNKVVQNDAKCTNNMSPELDMMEAVKNPAGKQNKPEREESFQAMVKYKPQFGSKKQKRSSSGRQGEMDCSLTASASQSGMKAILSAQNMTTELGFDKIVDETASDESAKSPDLSTCGKTDALQVAVKYNEKDPSEPPKQSTSESSASDKGGYNNETELAAGTKTNTLISDDRSDNRQCMEMYVNDQTMTPGKDRGSGSLLPAEPVPTVSDGKVMPNNSKKKQQNKNKSDIINQSVPKHGKTKSKTESLDGKKRKSTLGKGSKKVRNEKSNVQPADRNETEAQSDIGIRYFLEHQEELAQARNALRFEQQRKEGNYRHPASAADTRQKSLDSVENQRETKQKELDDEVYVLETAMKLVRSLSEGEQEHDTCLSLFTDIRQKASAALLLKYPVILTIIEPVQRYTSDERIKQEAEDMYMLFNSMYIREDMEDFISAFDRSLKYRQQCLARHERLAKKTMEALNKSEVGQANMVFDTDKWSDLMKERANIWERFVQTFETRNDTKEFNGLDYTDPLFVNLKESESEADFGPTEEIEETTREQNKDIKQLLKYSRKMSTSLAKSKSKIPRKRLKAIVKQESASDVDTDVKPAICKRKRQNATVKQESASDVDTHVEPAICKRKRQKATIKTESASDIDIDVKPALCKLNVSDLSKQRACKTLPKIKQKEAHVDKLKIKIKSEIVSNDETLNTNARVCRKQYGRRCKADQPQPTRQNFVGRKRGADKETIKELDEKKTLSRKGLNRFLTK